MSYFLDLLNMHLKDKLFTNIISSPVDNSELYFTDSTLIDENGNYFEIVDNTPILIDFNDSIVKKSSSFKSCIQRSSLSITLKNKLNLNNITKNNSKLFYDHLLENSNNNNLLIIGGGSIGNNSEILYGSNLFKTISMDIYNNENVDVVADAHKIPFKSNSIGAVWIQAVLEHVLNPEIVVSEIFRVLEPGGIVYAEVPFMQPVHEGAYDFKRYSRSALRYLFRKFDLITCGPMDGAGSALRWSMKYLFEGLFRSRIVGKLAYYLLFPLSWIDLAIPSKYKNDSATGYYILCSKSEKTISPKDILCFYGGVQNQ